MTDAERAAVVLMRLRMEYGWCVEAIHYMRSRFDGTHEDCHITNPADILRTYERYLSEDSTTLIHANRMILKYVTERAQGGSQHGNNSL